MALAINVKFSIELSPELQSWSISWRITNHVWKHLLFSTFSTERIEGINSSRNSLMYFKIKVLSEHIVRPETVFLVVCDFSMNELRAT